MKVPRYARPCHARYANDILPAYPEDEAENSSFQRKRTQTFNGAQRMFGGISASREERTAGHQKIVFSQCARPR